MNTKVILFMADLVSEPDRVMPLIENQSEFVCIFDEDYEDLALTHNGVIIATINRRYKWKIDDLILRNSATSIKPLSLNKDMIEVQLTLTSNLDINKIPAVSEGPIAGIYLIRNKNNSSVYIGQSGNINQRIVKHWYELSLGTHHNRPLQSEWGNSGEHFEVKVLEVFDGKYIGNYEQQKFLESREQYWIAKYGESHQVLNRTKGEVVPTKLATKEFDEDMRKKDDERDRRVKDLRRALNEKIKTLEEERRVLNSEKYKSIAESKKIKSILFKNTGLFRIFSSIPKDQIESMRSILLNLNKQIQLHENSFQMRTKQILDLKVERKKHRTTKELGIKRRQFR
jgi:group I intron endonuclease